MLTRHCYGALLTAAILAGTTSISGAAGDPVQVIVRIENYAGVPARTLEMARAEVQAVFLSAGVRVAWEDAAHADRPHADPVVGTRVILLVVDLETAAGNPATSMLGLAVRPKQNAFVFYNRIIDVTSRRGLEAGVLLGRVMAHEIGHLLLPPGRHSHYGIMQENVDVDGVNPSRFTLDEADRIRKRLTPLDARPQPPAEGTCTLAER